MEILEYINLLIELELNVGDLYKVFADNNSEDYIFWIQLYNEENNHATLLKTCIDFVNNDIDISIIITDDTNSLINLNNHILQTTEQYIMTLGRELSFEIGMLIETSANESHYQEIMTNNNDNDNKILNIIKKLNKEYIDHYNRIKKYYENIKW